MQNLIFYNPLLVLNFDYFFSRETQYKQNSKIVAIREIYLTLIRLGFLKVVFFWDGDGQFDPPLFVCSEELYSINKTLYNC